MVEGEEVVVEGEERGGEAKDLEAVNNDLIFLLLV